MRKTTEAELSRHPDLDQLEGYLWRREGARLAYLAERVPAGQVIVEIGSNRGKSACFLARGSKAGNGVKVHCVDLWTTGGQHPDYKYLAFDTDATLAKFRAQIAAVKVKSMIVEHQADSVATGESWSGAPIGLLFIDGDHHHSAVKADWEAWSPHLAPGAVVAFHDYTSYEPKSTQFPGVAKLVDRLITEGVLTDVTRSGRLVTATVNLPDVEVTEEPPVVEAPVEEPEHVLDADCWCEPEVITVDASPDDASDD